MCRHSLTPRVRRWWNLGSVVLPSSVRLFRTNTNPRMTLLNVWLNTCCVLVSEFVSLSIPFLFFFVYSFALPNCFSYFLAHPTRIFTHNLFAFFCRGDSTTKCAASSIAGSCNSETKSNNPDESRNDHSFCVSNSFLLYCFSFPRHWCLYFCLFRLVLEGSNHYFFFPRFHPIKFLVTIDLLSFRRRIFVVML